ncbi:MAG TPA: acyl-CoA dehydrogenase family protein [Bryobacteraceae bacterium]|nr:acyl-CoA dehydrogenase family protein [Bryobacteraceae bacterium]
MIYWPAQTHGLNFYACDGNLQRFLERSGLSMRWQSTLTDFGSFCGGELDSQAAYSDHIHPPVLRHEITDPIHPDQRRGHVYLNPRYEAAQQELSQRGFLASCFAEQMLPFVAQYLVSKSDIATGCPFAMSHPVALLIDRHASADLKARLLPELLRTDGHAAVGGTWATEKHSGSDIGNTKTRAVHQPDGTVRLHGENWFTSAIGFSRFVTIKTARPDGAPSGGKGIGLYLVPSHIDTDWQVANDYDVLHLKEKVGTRGLPTGEVKLTGTLAYELAPAGSGMKMMMEALGCSRVHNAMGAAGVMHRALMEAMCWTSHRSPFGKRLVEQPMVQKRILDLETEWLSGSALAFEAARSFGDGQTVWPRVATALAKYKTAEQAVWCTRKALELVGGNGYTEEYPVARLFRDAQVLTVWEGPEQIQALELMRLITQDHGDQAYLDRLSAIQDDRLKVLTAEMKIAFDNLAQKPAAAVLTADEYLQRMADVLAYGLLCEEGAWELQNCDDTRKMRFAARFYERTFVHHVRPSLEIPRFLQTIG